MPVRAQDCVASILRAGKRLTTVQTLMDVTDEVKALDDKRIEFRLKKRFALLPFALSSLFIMPERIAKTDAFMQISDNVSSGPYRFVRDEWKPGSGAAYARNEKYLARQEPISMWAGGKVANFDRIEWKTIPDPATQAAALQRNEVDWVEAPLIDLTPMLRKASGVRVEVFDKLGSLMLMAFNFYHPPFDNVKLRRAVLSAVNQQDFVDASSASSRTSAASASACSRWPLPIPPPRGWRRSPDRAVSTGRSASLRVPAIRANRSC